MFKMIHTADWHLGRILHGVSLLGEQRELLNQVYQQLEIERPQLLVIAGDLYDRSVPPVEAVELLDGFLSRVSELLKIPVAIIAGNHDSPGRLGFASGVLAQGNVYVAGKWQTPPVPITLGNGNDRAQVWLMPYEDPIEVRHDTENPEVKVHEDAVRERLNVIEGLQEKEVLQILVAHQFVMGGEAPEQSESERPLSIGGTDLVSASCFCAFDRVLLGHLHRKQQIAKNIWYSGSLMQYSFSEVNHSNGLLVHEIEDSGPGAVRQIKLMPQRALRVITGNLETLLRPETYIQYNREDYILAQLTDDEALLDPAGQLRTVYPNLLKVVHVSDKTASETTNETRQDIPQWTPQKVVENFYESVTGRDFDDARKEVLKMLLEKELSHQREVTP